MKRSQLIYVVFLGSMAFGSCTRTFYKHQLMLENCHTHDDVSKQLGPPDEKIYTKTTEEWVYNLDGHHHVDAPKLPMLVIDSLHTGNAINYYRHLEFTFDLHGNVIRYQSNIPDPIRALTRRDDHVTALGTVGAILLLSFIIFIDIITKTEPTF